MSLLEYFKANVKHIILPLNTSVYIKIFVLTKENAIIKYNKMSILISSNFPVS